MMLLGPLTERDTYSTHGGKIIPKQGSFPFLKKKQKTREKSFLIFPCPLSEPSHAHIYPGGGGRDLRKNIDSTYTYAR